MKRALFGTALACFLLSANMTQAGPGGGISSKIPLGKTPMPAALACPSAQSHYTLISSKLNSEIPFCQEYLSAKNDKNKYQDGIFNIMNICMKMDNWLDHNAECQPHYNYIWDLLHQLQDKAEQKMAAETPTCTPHLNNIEDLQAQLKDAKNAVCQACDSSPDDASCGL